MIRQCFPLAAVLWFSAAAAGRAEPGPPVGRQKKLIFYGINVISAHNLHESAAELADEYPELDGVIVNFWPDDCKYRHWGGCNGLFGARAYTRDDFARTIADLQRVPLPERLKENFLYVKTTVNAGPKMMATPEETVNIDWFDPGWAAITRNMALFAQIAREAGFRGLQFDFEEYSTPHNPLWRYFASRVFRQYRADRGLPEMGFEEYAAQARQRGRQMMTAVTAAYPDMTLLMIPDTGWPGHGDYDLLPAFVDGILEGAGPDITLIDGLEQGYPLQTYRDFLSLKHEARAKGIAASQIPDLYRERIRHSLGLWLDYRPDEFGGWHTDDGKLEMNLRSPDRLERALYNALTVSERYVWMLVWHPDWWLRPSARSDPGKLMHPYQCFLCPHRTFPEGYRDALKNCYSPHDLAWESPTSHEHREYTESELLALGPNLLTNGSFEHWAEQPDRQPDDWRLLNVARARRVQTGAKNDRFCARLGRQDEAHHGLDQDLPVDRLRGRTIVLGVWCRTGPGANGSPSVLCEVRMGADREIVKYHTAGGGDCPKDNAWRFMSARITVPEAAVKAWVRLNGYSFRPGAGPEFDGAIAVIQPEPAAGTVPPAE